MTGNHVIPGMLLLALMTAICAGCHKAKTSRIVGSDANASFMELTVEVTSTFKSASRTNRSKIAARCTFGPTNWFIAGDLAENAFVEYWLDGNEVIRRSTVTSSMYLRQGKEFIEETVNGRKPLLAGLSYPRAGKVYLNRVSRDWPGGGAVENILWLAFCSKNYLKDDRRLPLPVSPVARAFNASNTAERFSDSFGLPNQCSFRTADGRLVCRYVVLESTNFQGHQLPLRFRLLHNNRGLEGDLKSSITTEITGTVTGLRLANRPEPPATN